MAKAYWIACYREIIDTDKLTAYAKLALPAITAGGGKLLARGSAAFAFEDGLKERTVLIEFPDLEAALSTHESDAYREAVAALDGGAIRDLRLIEGI